MNLTDFDALSFDCYGTLIDWEAGLAAVLAPWARSRASTLSDEALLTRLLRARGDGPRPSIPASRTRAILARSLRGLGGELGGRGQRRRRRAARPCPCPAGRRSATPARRSPPWPGGTS